MSGIKNVALIGSSSVLSKAILETLPSKFNITILHRASSSVDPSANPSITYKAVDYDSHSSVVEALKGIDAVISLVGFPGITLQTKIIDAAVEAGVKRFIPSEFGVDLTNEKAGALPVFTAKKGIEEYIEKVHKEKGLEYDLIATGLFTEMAIETGFIGFKITDKTARLVDGGKNPITLSSYPFIARALSSILSHPASNAFVKIYDLKKSASELLSIAQELTGKDGWTVEEPTSEEVLEQSKKLRAEGQDFPALLNEIIVAATGAGWGSDYEGDNERLGLKPWTDEETKEFLKKAVEEAGKKA